MTIFLLIVVFTMLVFLLVSLPSKKARAEAPADGSYLPMSRATEISGNCAQHDETARHSGGAAQSGQRR